MLRMSKLTDYGTLVLAHLAASEDRLASAHQVSMDTRLSLPTVSKLLKSLVRAGLAVSRRGARGGYALSRSAEEISAADILDALEGPLAITECSSAPGLCGLESSCRVGGAWQKINAGIRQALDEVSLADLRRPAGPDLPADRWKNAMRQSIKH